MKLDAKYKHTRSSLIMMKELPSMSEIYGILVQEQVHQGITKGDLGDIQENSMAYRVEKRKYDKNKYSANKKQMAYCDHCKIQGHTMDKCWKIHRYPPKFKNNSWKKDGEQYSKGHIAFNEGTDVQERGSFDTKLTQQQYLQLMTLLSKQQTSASEPQEITHVSNSTQLTGKALSDFNKSKWIIDLGATDHVCSQYELFDSCETLNN